MELRRQHFYQLGVAVRAFFIFFADQLAKGFLDGVFGKGLAVFPQGALE